VNDRAENGSRTRRSFGQRLDTAGGKLMAIVAAVGVIASTGAGVKALLPKDEKQPGEQADLGGLRTHVVALRSFESKERLIAAKSPVVARRSGPVLVASSKPVAYRTLAADPEPGAGGRPSPDGSTGSPSPDGSGSPPPDDSTGSPSPDGSGPPSPGGSTGSPAPEGSGSPSPGGSAGASSPGAASRPIEIEGDKLPRSNIEPKRIAIRDEDLQKGAPTLRQETQALQKQENDKFSMGSCAGTAGNCPMTGDLELRRGGSRRASPATREAAAKLALIREELRQLRHTKTTRGPDGKRDPLGVRLDYRLRLCGFSSQSVRVFWTLFDSREPPRIPYDWDSNRLANTIERKSAGCQSVFPSFWVPIPAAKGRFTVALAAYDEQGVRRGPLIESRPFVSR
jgi:hypothetical protein